LKRKGASSAPPERVEMVLAVAPEASFPVEGLREKSWMPLDQEPRVRYHLPDSMKRFWEEATGDGREVSRWGGVETASSDGRKKGLTGSMAL
jgi:hypothetical protein